MGTFTAEQSIRNSRIINAAIFLVGGTAIFVLGSNWTRWVPTQSSTFFKAALVLAFGLGAWLLAQYRPVLLALCIAAAANLSNWLLGNWLGRYVPAISVAHGDAIDKLAQMLPVVLTIVLLALLTGRTLGSLYLRWGDWKAGLRFGLTSFAVFALAFVVIVRLQADSEISAGLLAGGLLPAAVFTALPWILTFAFANAMMEEIWFRGLLFAPLEQALGSRAAILLTALVFSLAHAGAAYIVGLERIIFPLIVFGLGVLGAHIMHKTRSLLGPILFHAGYDLLIIIPVLLSNH